MSAKMQPVAHASGDDVDASHATSSFLHLHPSSLLCNIQPCFVMPRLNENTERQLHELEHGARTGTSRAWDSFSNFALRDNVLEVAVGLM